jgi:uncharacterized protein (TIGR03083 family)
MEATLPAIAGVPVDRIEALRRESDAVLRFCADLSPEEWNAPSRAAGWRVRDVIAHLAAGSRLMFSLDVIELMRTRQVERFNDKLVADRQDMSPAEILSEYRTWGSRVARLLGLVGHGPVGSMPLRVGELGWYPARLVASALTFDAHTHLRHDVAPALERPVPPSDGRRMAVALEWLLALLEQLNADQRAWLDRPLGLHLTGDGGGTWRLIPTGRGRLKVAAGTGAPDGTAGTISGSALDFPAWATRRTSWRACAVTIEGDSDYATRFLDTVHLV